MNFRAKLSGRIGMEDIHEMTLLTQQSGKKKQELYQLLFDADDKLAYQAAWVFTHFSSFENQWLYDKQSELIDEVLVCTHPGKRRLLLTLLYRQPLAQPPRTDFLDFCLDRILSVPELPGVQSLCIKLSYEMCRSIPELLQELRVVLDMMDTNMLQTAIKTARKNVLKAMKTGKSLAKF